MSQLCCVENCKHSRSKNKCSLKRFPTDPQKCKLWEDIIKRDGWKRNPWDRICECHFSDEQFEQNRADGLRKLRYDAFPTLFGLNIRIPTKAATGEAVDRKDSEGAAEENDDLEELEVEIEENSNSDECSDVETYIITGELGQTIQVIKEKELPSTTKSIEKQPTDPSLTGKSKTKRIVIRVPSSVGESTPASTESGISGSGISASVEEDVVREHQSGEVENIGEEGKISEHEEERRRGEGVEESNTTETTVDENNAADEKSEDSHIVAECLDVETSTEIQEEVENSTVGCDPAENVTESDVENLGGDATIENYEENVAVDVEAGGFAPDVMEEETSSIETNIQVTDTEMSEPQVLEEQPKETVSATEDVENNSIIREIKPLDQHGLFTDPDLSQLKSDWKNPRLKARDVKIMACSGSSRNLFKKKHLLQSKPRSETENSSNVCKEVDSKETAETCRTVAETLEEAEDPEKQTAQDNSAEDRTPEGQLDSGTGERAPSSSYEAELQIDSSFEEQEPLAENELVTKERIDGGNDGAACEVSDAYGREDGSCVSGRTVADETIASIEEKLEKIFSNDGGNVKEVNIQVEPSSENLQELANNDDPQQDASDEELDVVTSQAEDQQGEHSLEETENAGDEAENQVSSGVDKDGSAAQGTEKDQETSLAMEVTEDSLDQVEESFAANDSAKDGQPLSKSPEESEEMGKMFRKRREAGARNQTRKDHSASVDIEEAAISSKETEPDSRTQESSRRIVSGRNRGWKDGAEESVRRKDSNHRESNRRTEIDKKASPDRLLRQHNSHSSKDEKSSAKRTARSFEEGRKISDEEKHGSDRKLRKMTSPSRESLRQSETAAKGGINSKDLRSSRRCLISSAPPRRRQPIKEEVVEEEEKSEDEEVEDEDEKRKSSVGKRSKVLEEAANPALGRRRGRPVRGRESVSEKAPPSSEEMRSIRHSRRTSKPPEKFKDSTGGRPADGESSRRIQKRKFSTEEEQENVGRKNNVGRPGPRSAKRRAFRASSPVHRKRLEVVTLQDDDEEDDDVAGSSPSVCRVCGTEQQILLNIFGPEGTQLRLEDKIHTHLPIRVRQHDKLPLGVCHSCVVTLSACDSLVDKCTQVDKKLRKIFNCPADEAAEERVEHTRHPRQERPRSALAHKAQIAERAPKPVTAEQQQDRSRSPVNKQVETVEVGMEVDERLEELKSVEKTPNAPVAVPVADPVAEAAAESVAVPVSEPVAQPVAESVAVPVADPVAEPVAVSIASDVAQPRATSFVEDVEEEPQQAVEPQIEETERLRTTIVESGVDADIPLEMSAESLDSASERERQMEIAEQLAEAVQHDAILVKKEEYDSEMASPMKRFGNTYSTGRRSTSRVLDVMDTLPQDRNSVIVIPPAETLRTSSNDVAPHSEEYILSVDEPPPDDAPKTVIDSILDDWDEDDQERASTSAANSRVLTIKNAPDSEIVVTRLYNDEEEMLAGDEGGEIIIQIHTEGYPEERQMEPFWPTPDPTEESILPDNDDNQNLTWKCAECGLRGKSVGTFIEHKKTHQPQEKKFFCSLCDQRFNSVEMLAVHKREKHYEDDDDDEDEDEDEDELAMHPRKMKQLAPLDIEEGGFYPGGNCKLYKCAQCDKMFGAAWSWKKHMEAHELDSTLADNRVNKCNICSRTFFDKATFEDHKLTHTEGETPFQCAICDAKFATWKVFLPHVQTHTSSKTFCRKCGRDFGDVKTLREHRKEVHPVNNEKRFACHLCDKVCRKKIALTEHLRKHTGEMPFECSVCQKRFSRLANYRAHVAIHENLRRFACDVCGKRFNRQSIQQRHMKTHMRDTIKTSHVCRVCGEAFNKVNELLEHRLNHTRDDVERAHWMDVKLRGDVQDFTCKVCETRFSTVEAVLLHMPSHTDDERDIALKRKPKAYTCDICHRTLWSKRTFQSHKQWHEQKQFPCTQCDKKYATQTGLNYHMFLHTGERPFQCEFCNKCYKNKNDLRIHVRLHTGEYPYKCKFCPKAFRSHSSLIKHGDAHTEERPFKCSFCDQAFKRENTRANHERIHTNDKRFHCKYCNKGFIQKGACMKHEKWHENEIQKTGSTSTRIDRIDMEEIDSRDSLDVPEHSESGDSMDSYSGNMVDDHDVKEVDVGGLSIPSQPSQPIIAEPVDELNATAPSSDDRNVHITLL